MTGEPPDFARFGLRVAAGALDVTLFLCAAAVLTWLGLEIRAEPIGDRSALVDVVGRLWREALLLPVAILTIAAMAASWTWALATPGQMLMGCRVRRARADRPLNVLLAAWRSLLILALAGPAAVPLLTMFVDRRRRGLHDLLSDAVVVMEDESQVSLADWVRRLR